MNSDAELWKPIVGWEGFYEVSNYGRVRSLGRVVPHADHEIHIRGRILRSSPKAHGYIVVSLCRNGKPLSHRVHRLVAQAFHPNPDGLPEVNHIDGDKQNNHASNLEWVSPLGNSQHAWRTGLSTPMLGTTNGRSKLTETDVVAIRRRLANGELQRAVALDYGIDRTVVSRINTGDYWSHVKDDDTTTTPIRRDQSEQ